MSKVLKELIFNIRVYFAILLTSLAEKLLTSSRGGYIRRANWYGNIRKLLAGVSGTALAFTSKELFYDFTTKNLWSIKAWWQKS